jgi:hypothetical protein
MTAVHLPMWAATYLSTFRAQGGHRRLATGARGYMLMDGEIAIATSPWWWCGQALRRRCARWDAVCLGMVSLCGRARHGARGWLHPTFARV